MRFLYSILSSIAVAVLPLGGLFSKKMKLFVSGRKDVFETLQKHIASSDKVIWFHCASLGEYEQGLPVMEALKGEYPNHKQVITFFSPSGYENKKNSSIGDVTVYLPIDTKKNAKRFLDVVHPDFSIFIKYELWPNYLLEMKKRSIPVFLISALFRKNQVFFKPHGFWMRKVLKSFTHIFVQDEKSKHLLESIDIKQVSISGDTRYDRVSKQIEEDNNLGFVESFKGNSLCVVAGSTWPEDEAVLIDYINLSAKGIKFIIAPHNLKGGQIEKLQNQLTKKAVRFTEMENKPLFNFDVFILDTIGLLKKVYSYADVAYVGGGMGSTGLHNVLEAAAFGVPIVIGKHFEKFPEAKALQSRAGLFAVAGKEALQVILNKLLNDKSFREKTGIINGHYVQDNTGATQMITGKIKQVLN